MSRRLLLSLTALLAACSGGGGGDTSFEVSSLQFSSSASTQTVNGSGEGSLTVSTAQTSGASAVVFNGPVESRIEITSLKAPSGNELVSQLGSALRTQFSPASIQVPPAGSPREVGTYRIGYRVLKRSGSNTLANSAVSISIGSKLDSDLSRGTVAVNIIFVGPTGGSENTREATEEGVAKASDILSSAGLSLDVAYFDAEGTAVMPNPQVGHPAYARIANLRGAPAINIAIAADVSGLTEPNDRYSLPAAIPQSPFASARSVAVISVRDAAGSNGLFEDRGGDEVQDERRLLGEEIAQLIGHALGLEDIVTFSGDNVSRADTLGDTPSCIRQTDCRDEDSVRGNFMFPYPVREFGSDSNSGDTYARLLVTPSQAAVMNASPLVD